MREKSKMVKLYESAYGILKNYCEHNDKIMTAVLSRLVKEYLK